MMTKRKSSVNERSQSRGGGLFDETIPAELCPLGKKVCITSVDGRLAKSVLETPVQAKVEQVVFERQRAGRQVDCGDRTVDEGASIDSHVVWAACKARVQF
jgi:hypothetical protein